MSIEIIKCDAKDMHCPTPKETLDYYENFLIFLIHGYEEDIKKLQKENEKLKNRDTNRLSEIGELRTRNSYLEDELKYYYVSKDKIREIKNKNIGQYMNFYREIEELL